MAANEHVKRIAGYRSRDHDDIQFIEVTGEDFTHPVDLVLTIEPEQLMFVGDVDLAAFGDQRSMPGEWGRVGPPRSIDASSSVTSPRK